MTRPDFLAAYARRRRAAPTVVGPGLGSRELFALIGEDPTVLYNMDMAYAAPICLGLALATDLPRVVALEGDGSLLTGLGVLTTIARHGPPSLTLIALDNESYGTFGHGEMASATACGADLEQIAQACGLRRTVTVRSIEEAELALDRALNEPGPWLVVAKLEHAGDVDARFARVPPDVADAGVAFYQALRQARGQR